MWYLPGLISVFEMLLIIIPVSLTVVFVTVAERKTMASMQRRLSPNNVGYSGLLQALAHALKLFLKEHFLPTQANLMLFYIGPITTLVFFLLGYAVIPHGPGLTIWDFNLGNIYILAFSSFLAYGILLSHLYVNYRYSPISTIQCKNSSIFFFKYFSYILGYKNVFFIWLSIRILSIVTKVILSFWGLNLMHLLLLPVLIYLGIFIGRKLSLLCSDKVFYFILLIASIIVSFELAFFISNWKCIVMSTCVMGFRPDPFYWEIAKAKGLGSFLPKEIVRKIHQELHIVHFRRADGTHGYKSLDPLTDRSATVYE